MSEEMLAAALEHWRKASDVLAEINDQIGRRRRFPTEAATVAALLAVTELSMTIGLLLAEVEGKAR